MSYLYVLLQTIFNIIRFTYLIHFYPKGTWIETAKNIKYKNNILCAELYNGERYNKSCIKVKKDKDEYFINVNGEFDKIYHTNNFEINYFPKGNWYENATKIEFYPNRVCAKLKHKIWFYNCIRYDKNDYLINYYGLFKKLDKFDYIKYEYKQNKYI